MRRDVGGMYDTLVLKLSDVLVVLRESTQGGFIGHPRFSLIIGTRGNNQVDIQKMINRTLSE